MTLLHPASADAPGDLRDAADFQALEVSDAAPPSAPPPTPAQAKSPAGRASPGERAWNAEHPVNIRLSLPLPFGPYYLTIVSGRERRSADRLAQERLKHPVETRGNNVFLFLGGAVFGLASLAVLQAVSAFLVGGGTIALP